ncbi:hypothetical protein ACFQ1I_04035 [Kitasatospora arboriphila]
MRQHQPRLHRHGRLRGRRRRLTRGKVYAASLVGDVVIIRNSVKKQPLDPANGLSGWTMPWSQW